jgi:hypothetical protein
MRQRHHATVRLGLCTAAVLMLTGAQGKGCEEPPSPPPCQDGYHLEEACKIDGCSSNDPYCDPKPVCEKVCVPDGCPAGTVAKTACGKDLIDYPAGSEKIDPSGPPPTCWTECVPVPSCPPGQHPEEICTLEPTCHEPTCKLVCVDDYPKCDPNLVCGDAVTCVDGYLYPTTCGPKNCDKPIDKCDPPPACDPTLLCAQVLTCIDGYLYPTACGPKNCDEPIDKCDRPY